MQLSYYQPEYFLKFRCIGGDCPQSCCHNWRVGWSRDELDRLKSVENLSDELRDVIDNYFVPDPDNPNNFFIKMLADSACPFQDSQNGLCHIQLEAGEEYLGETCTKFPRDYLIVGNLVLRQCMTSCPAVIKLLMHDKKAAQMEIIPKRDHSIGMIKQETPEKHRRVPYLQYRKEIIDFYSWLFTSRRDHVTAMLMGALAAKEISDSAVTDNGLSIAPRLAMIKEEWSVNDPDIQAQNIETNYVSKWNCIKALLKEMNALPVDINVMNVDDKIDPEKYREGREKFFAAIHNPEIALNNIAMNLFLNMFVRLILLNHTFFEFYAYYAICMTTAVYTGYAAAYSGGDVEGDFTKALAKISRRAMHSRDNQETIFKHIVDLLNSPELLATVIK